jgi:hypothetical protein
MRKQFHAKIIFNAATNPGSEIRAHVSDKVVSQVCHTQEHEDRCEPSDTLIGDLIGDELRVQEVLVNRNLAEIRDREIDANAHENHCE